ncbi:fibrillin-3-like [Tubulanus polymorphus]|uniref:fibrillin-3-like n=1 Tax=Tubulanus polymorphus TaxID=672921 RepID=UPI003DA3019F
MDQLKTYAVIFVACQCLYSTANVLSGPNICGYPPHHTDCCPGWTLNRDQNKCTVPVCTGSCGAGTCMRPNLCYCPNGQIAPSCSFGSSNIAAAVDCQSRCYNGGSCNGTSCNCQEGFGGQHCGQPMCSGGCLNNGRCVGPNRCLCHQGYTGRNCEVDFRTGPCFTQIERGRCQGQMIGITCTQSVCCATIGKAWGNPCRRCQPEPSPCRRGFLLNKKENICIDIDECLAIPRLCIAGKCINTVGSYRCVCEQGQVKDPIAGGCRAVSDCESNLEVCKNGQCHVQQKGYFCTCNQGFTASSDRKSCIDNRRMNCFSNFEDGRCTSRLGMQMTLKECCCTQGTGWGDRAICHLCASKGTEVYRKLCFDENQPTELDECTLFEDTCVPHGRCINTQTSFRCQCDLGFRQLVSKCVDKDECEDDGICRDGHCLNTVGSFKCRCNAGFIPSADGTSCRDMDECSKTGMCENGICINMQGTYKCRCNPGYIQSQTNNQRCLDINECQANPGVCHNGYCINSLGTFRCHCNPGYELAPDNSICVDINECKSLKLCVNGRCVNNDGSFTCLCNTGWILSTDRSYCIDINECANDNDLCLNGDCLNSPGSFRCRCPHGLTLSTDGKSCKDTRKGYCYQRFTNGECLNPVQMLVTRSQCCCSMGAMVAKGLAWGKPLCNACPKYGTVEFQNVCVNGMGKDSNGEDVNECVVQPGICVNGVCENKLSGYRCICNAGYVADITGRLCNDIDECSENPRLCLNGHCQNTEGSFQCDCKTGYKFNPVTKMCDDIIECSSNPERNPCLNGRCQNTPGSYVCKCDRPGEILDPSGKLCIDQRRSTCWSRVNKGSNTLRPVCEGALHTSMTKSDCCATLGTAWGSPCAECPENIGLCAKGYEHDGSRCIDINECNLYPEACKDGRCVNNIGSFLCQCPPGFRLDASGTKCKDERRSKCFLYVNNGICSHQTLGLHKMSVCCCSKTVGRGWGEYCEPCPARGTDSFRELCTGGDGMLPFPEREDIDECKTFPSLCSNGRCINSIPGFECKCKPGYGVDDNERNCTDIDECTISTEVCGNGSCLNIPGSFRCKCHAGFESTAMMQMCMDIDECGRDPSLCLGGSCQNTVGSFKCVCLDGHEVTPNGRGCKDVNECSSTSGICSNGRCENFMGGFQCFCQSGYKPNPTKTACTDIDECAVQNGGCSHSCVNSPGSFLCECRHGFKLMPDRRRCTDMDECSQNPSVCGGGKCKNEIGSYGCICQNGWILSENRKSCTDVDECTRSSHLCRMGTCKNTLGSYTCDCELGFSMKKASQGCSDDDECTSDMHHCDGNALCINSHGSYKCQCNQGYKGNGFQCDDINECIVNNGGCARDASCHNTRGSFRCICDDGFSGDGFKCDDINECEMNGNLCVHGDCINYPGGYRCECDMGYTSTNQDKQCVDIDECNLFRNLCSNGHCENEKGSYKCICNQGYKLDTTAGNCTDVDECQNSENCLYGRCVNSYGGYVCQCPPHYELNPPGTACIDKREGICYLDKPTFGSRGSCHKSMPARITRSTCCCTIGKAWGENEGYCDICPQNGTKLYDLVCPGGPGFRPNILTVILEDIDECEAIPGICKAGACKNTFGSFVCICPDGYRLNNTDMDCVDIDECAENPSRCVPGTCVNTRGNYTCRCPPNHKLMPSGRHCMDMRKSACYLQVTGLSACTNPIGTNLTKMACCCSLGKAWDNPCVRCPLKGSAEHGLLCSGESFGEINAINECVLIPELCKNGDCIDTVGSFRCQCPHGFTLDPETVICEDDDECRTGRNNCVGNAICVNEPGRYRCKCPNGYDLQPDRSSCRDIDECTNSVAENCKFGICRNNIGSYSCLCNQGFKLNVGGNECIDIDECSTQPSICRNGTCTNTNGSYRCTCNQGFTITSTGDCFDKNECRDLGDVCFNGRCKNVVGSYTCQCQPGFSVDANKNCKDINECRENASLCLNGKCENTPGTYLCICNAGYEVTANRDTCVDVNECEQDPHLCHGGICKNSLGSFRCICRRGYVLSSNGRICVDKREGYCYKKFENGRCHDPRRTRTSLANCCCTSGAAWSWGNGACEVCPDRDQGSYSLMCPDGPGYTMGPDGGMNDVDECDEMDACANGMCINTDGSYRCECKTGYMLLPDGKTCIDEDECARHIAPCGQGECKNYAGGFRCICSNGFQPGSTGSCEDRDECSDGEVQCAYRCQNTRGSYRCICPLGYKLADDAIHCEDIDECSGNHGCPYECKNLVGNFMCICPEGYLMQGKDNCRDEDECLTGKHKCGIHGRCINTAGGYACDCSTGFERSQDGKHCQDKREGYCFHMFTGSRCIRTSTISRTTRIQCCCATGAAWGSHCEACPRKGTRRYGDMCPFGPGYDNTGRDIDECKTMPAACQFGSCLNTLGSYRCICNSGYRTHPNGKSCIDIDECSMEQRVCQQKCVNSQGSYTCGCQLGFVVSIDGRCKGSGERAWREKRKHIDECDQDQNKCRPSGVCVNSAGSFKCACRRGFRMGEDGKCTDVNECNRKSGPCKFQCRNQIGGYRCRCPNGYKQINGQCLDENECNTPGVCGQRSCINMLGSYRCMCPPEARFDSVKLSCDSVSNRQCGTNDELCRGTNIGSQESGFCASERGNVCTFNCINEQMGSRCGCPSGYQNLGRGHCVTFASTPLVGDLSVKNREFVGEDLPHVAAPEGSDGLPDEEGCYNCDGNTDGTRNARRTKRDANVIDLPHRISKKSIEALNNVERRRVQKRPT